jgi:hypothetical protein
MDSQIQKGRLPVWGGRNQRTIMMEKEGLVKEAYEKPELQVIEISTTEVLGETGDPEP